jgi:hypothetical protein
MLEIKKEADKFVFEVKGLHKLWALKSQITIPKENILKTYPNKEVFNWLDGLKMPGTHIPGVITAGTYIVKDDTIFYDVTDYSNCIVIELKDEHYSKLIIEVENVEEALNMLNGE